MGRKNMYSIIEGLEKEAMGLVKNLNKHYLEGEKNAYFPVLIGMGPYVVQYAYNGHNSNVVVRAIHACYRENSRQLFDQGFQDGLLYMCQVANKWGAMSMVIDIFFYELKLEKEGKAAFFIEREPLISAIREKFKEKDAEFRQNADYADWVTRLNKYAKREYGIDLP